ncbi:hypothetical protein PIB30_098099 [Stylosanthes scabra]|uniref:Uncharacterized protein n=1 Tax=Stylosanthes scabra TaxID=79078 RepID=A0ABU6XVH2_9FABA|nr:hypothetical protein [Stylosanthes scabra]
MVKLLLQRSEPDMSLEEVEAMLQHAQNSPIDANSGLMRQIFSLKRFAIIRQVHRIKAVLATSTHSVDFHTYAWVFILGLELGWPPRICFLQRIYVGLMNLKVEFAFHVYAGYPAHMRGSRVGLAS